MSYIACLNKNIPLPNVEDIKPGRIPLGETATTKGGRLRRHVTATRKTWTVQLEELTRQEYDPIVAHWDLIWGTQTWFWYDEMGGDPANTSVAVIIDIESDQRVAFNRDGVYHYDGHNLTLKFTEVG